MKRAIIALTRNGTDLGRRLHAVLEETELYLPEKLSSGENGELRFDSPVAELTREIFSKYENLIFIMATGIALRAVAPLLRGKHEDPGVIAIDEKGHHVISLLGGHSRQSNDLTHRIASLIGAEPVITTASDVAGFPPVDLLGKQFGWELESVENMTRVSAAVVNGEPVGLYQDAGERDFGRQAFPANVREYASLEELSQSDCVASILITDRTLDGQFQNLMAQSILYRPKSLVVGVGFNRGTGALEIESAIGTVLENEGLSLKSVRNLATIDLKAIDPELQTLSRKHGWEIKAYTVEQIKGVGFPSEPSEAVLKAVGVPAVSEPAAILSGGNSALIVSKTKLGNVTVAVAGILYQKRGKLLVVGTGPGHTEHLTLRAQKAITGADVILGYKTYIRLLGNLIQGKTVIESGMRHELDRAREAMALATAGKKVALVSGGDSGIYGMAAPVFEALSSEKDQNFDIEVIPGIPAFSAAAAVLGAPLSQDVSTISLSDLLTPWDVIVNRLHKAAEGDFVIAIYNPKSKGRPDQFAKAIDILREYRKGETPVGLVKNACRETQSSAITDLAHIQEMEIDMSSMILIGNSSSRAESGWMITPRGYRAKYG